MSRQKLRLCVCAVSCWLAKGEDCRCICKGGNHGRGMGRLPVARVGYVDTRDARTNLNHLLIREHYDAFEDTRRLLRAGKIVEA